MRWLLRFLKTRIIDEINVSIETDAESVHITVKFMGILIFQRSIKR